jgi:hypothetical protein
MEEEAGARFHLAAAGVARFTKAGLAFDRRHDALEPWGRRDQCRLDRVGGIGTTGLAPR